MKELTPRIIRAGKRRRRSFFIFALLFAAAVFLLRRRLEELSPFLGRYAEMLGANISLLYNALPVQGVMDKISLKFGALSNSVYLWCKLVYGANINKSWWLFSNWLTLAIFMGIIVPAAVLILFIIINSLNNYFKKFHINNKFISDVVRAISKKVNRFYRRSLFRNWLQASLMVMMVGAILFLLQLLIANLWWWNEGVGLSSLVLFILYAYWIYYDQIFGHNATKQRLLSRIDAYLKLKEGLLTIMETKNFKLSPRFYKLVLNEVIGRLKPANLSKILPHRLPRFSKRNLLIPLLVIICLSSLLSVAYSKLLSTHFFSAPKEKNAAYFPLDEEPESIETVLKQEADSLRILTDELRNSQTGQLGVVEDLDKLVIELTYLAGTPLDNNEGNLAVSKAQSANFPKASANNLQKPNDKPKTISWYKKLVKGLKDESQKEEDKSLDTALAVPEMLAGTSPDWPDGKPAGDNTVIIPLNPKAKQYQAASAELKKVAEQLLALKLDIDENLKETDFEQMPQEKGLSSSDPATDYALDKSVASQDEQLAKDNGNVADTEIIIVEGNENNDTAEKPLAKKQYNNKQASKKKPNPLVALLQKIRDRLTNISPKAKSTEDQAKQKTNTAKQHKPRSAASKAEKKLSKLSRKQPREPKSRSPKKTQFQTLVKNLNKIGDQLTKIKLAEQEEEQEQWHKPRENKEKPPPPEQHKAGGTILNKMELDPIKTNGKTEKPPDKPTKGVVRINSPHDMQIDPGLSPGAMKPAPLANRPLMLKAQTPQAGRRYLPATGGGLQLLSPPAYGRMEQKISTSAGRIRNLADQLLEVNNPKRISFNTQKADLISSLFEDAKISANKPRGIDNRLPRVSERISKIDAPREIEAITSELNQMAKEFQALGSNSGSKLARLRPDLTEMTSSDFLGRRSDAPLPQGGPDKADRQAVMIRGKRERASKSSEDLERIRVEESPRHLPTHDISANVSTKLQQVGEKLQNVDVASIKANMKGMNISDFMVERQRTLEVLDEQLPKAKDFQSVNQITGKIADLSAQLGKLTLDSMATANALANQQAISGTQGLSQADADRKLKKRIKQDGKKLLELSRQIKQAGSDQSRIAASSQILGLAGGLSKLDFNKIMLSEYNRRQLSNQLHNIGRQLQKTGQQTTDAAGLKTNSYAITALADRLNKLGAGDIGFSASMENRDRGEQLEFNQLADQLADLLPQAQAAAQSPTDYNATALQADASPPEALQPDINKKLMEELSSGARRLEQIKRKFELAGDQPELREELGRELLDLSRGLEGMLSRDTNNPLMDVSTKAIMSIGTQVREVGRQLDSNPAGYQQLSRRLQQMAGKLQERNQELAKAQLKSDQNVAKLSSDLLQLAEQLDKVAPAAITEQKKLAEEAGNRHKLEKQQRLIDKSSRDLFNMSQELAELSVGYADVPVAAGNYDRQIAEDVTEYTDRLGQVVNGLMNGQTPKQLDRRELGSLKRELAGLAEGLNTSGRELGADSASNAELNKLADELLELSQGLNQADLGRGEAIDASDNTDQQAASSLKDVSGKALEGRLGEIKNLNERLAREQDSAQARDMLLEMAGQLKGLAEIPAVAEDLALAADAKAKELKQRLSQINKLDAKLGQEIDHKMAKLMGENLLKLAMDLNEYGHGEQGPAASDEYPDSGELALKLNKVYQELNGLDLAQSPSESALAEEFGVNREYALKLKQMSSRIGKLPYAQMDGIAAALDRLGGGLSGAGGLGNGNMRLAGEAGKGDAQQKTKVALKNIDQALKRVKRLYKKAGDQYKPEFGQKKLKLAVKGKAKANKGVRGRLKDSPNTKGKFTADKTSKDIDKIPKTKEIKNVYTGERNLSERDVFERIIKRLESKRERIQRFEAAGALKPAKSNASSRKGDIKQPGNLDNEARMLAMVDEKLKPDDGGEEKNPAFTEKPASYKKAKDSSPYTYELSTPADDLDQDELSKLPLEQSKPKRKRQSNLTLHNKQDRDNAQADQSIPTVYRKIIKRLYLNGSVQ